MVVIYCIEDINDLKYVGSTKQTLNRRLSGHKYLRDCSSSKLNLFNCIIYPLEQCEESERKDRERYWINKIDCVNVIKLNWDKNNIEYYKEYQKHYRENNKDKAKEYRKQYDKEYRLKNKDKIREYQKQYYLKNKK